MRYLIGLISSFAIVSWANLAIGQSAIEHHLWQDQREFVAFSHTASAITGSIKLSGNKHFAKKGSTVTLTFGNGKTVKLTQIVAAWRPWKFNDNQKITAEVFRFDHDPGKLINGNTLCGNADSKTPIYVVFYEDHFVGTSDRLLELAMFPSNRPPHDINSKGICGTYNYSID